jgi:predicted nucleic acid-binding protein
VIVDASVAFKWIFVEEGSEAALALVGREDLRAPSLLLAEVGNGLWKKAHKGELTDQAAFPAQVALVASLVTFVDYQEATARALQMAVELDHPIYDCIYLALAEATDDILVSADARFIGKVVRSPYAEMTELLA